MSNPATESQLNFILKLSTERYEGEGLDAMFNLVNSGRLTKPMASGVIDGLMETPKLAKAAPKPPPSDSSVLAGRYAVEVDGTLGFFKVDRPEAGKWAGFTFVKQMASDDEYPVKGARKGVVLKAIEADAKAASIRYGAELGKCGICNRTLTDAASREAGIGPTCMANVGW